MNLLKAHMARARQPILDSLDTPAARGSLKRLAWLIREDWEVNARDWTLPGFRAVAVYRFGAWVVQQPRSLHRSVLYRIYRTMFRYVRNQYGLELPVTARIGRRVLFGHQAGIVIHPNAVIGDECVIRHNVTIGGTTWERGDEAPTLGCRVSVACGVSIVGKVTIGDDATIGPNAVVLTSVPPNSSVFVSAPRMFTFAKSNATRPLQVATAK
jgi:serine O-acetyltransferase